MVMKKYIFWVITPCSPLKGSACYMLQTGYLLGLFSNTDDEGDVFLRNVGFLSTGYMKLCFRR
jgi:hypothetical protein